MENTSPRYSFGSTTASPASCTAAWFRHGPVRTFKGPVTDKGCRVRFRLTGTEITGTALLDTGFALVLISKRFCALHGIQLDEKEWMEIHGIGQDFKRVPTAALDLEVLADEGAHLRLTDRAPVDTLPVGTDMLIGSNVLSLGVFTVDGPDERWTWRIDDERVKRRKLPNP